MKAKERAKAPRKVYCYDTGMVQAVRFRSGADTGRLLENIVAVELARRGEEFYCWKETTGKEVDFVVRREAGTAELIQVCYDLSEQKTRKREIQALIAAAGILQCGLLTVLTWDEEGEESSALSSILTTRAGSGGGEHRHPLPSCGHLLRGSMGSTIAIA